MAGGADPLRVFWQQQITVTAGATGQVLDLRGATGFTAILDGGTATWQPCDSEGTVVPGSSTTALSSAERVDTTWTHVKIVATTEDCIVAVV